MEEIDMIKTMFLAGSSAAIIAGKLGRSRQSVYKKIQKLALRDTLADKLKTSKHARDVDKKQSHNQKKDAVLAEKLVSNALAVVEDDDGYNEVLSNESATALAKAFEMVRLSESTSELNTALGAAQKADMLYRKANGLDQAGATGGVVNNFYMSGRADSPLRKKAEPVTDI